MIAHGDYASSHVVGRRIEEINLPKGTTIGAIMRRAAPAGEGEGESATVAEARVIIAHHDVVIESDDHVIVFVVNRHMVPKVEKLFQVNIGFV